MAGRLNSPATDRIPVFDPDIGEDEVNAVAAAVRAGEISGSFGPTIPGFEQDLAQYVGAAHGVACSNGTTALQLAVAAADIGPGDEVLVSASTHIATGLAIVAAGAVPVAVDSEAVTGNLDLDLVEGLINERTKAIMPVHLFGHPVDMDRLMEIAERHKLLVIEDAAEAHGAEVRGRKAGSFGHLACFSFYTNKIVTTGEGGMVLTSDDDLAARMRDLRNLGHQDPRFVHHEIGFNFRMTGYQAAMGRVQMAKIEESVEARRALAGAYTERLDEVPGIRTPVELDWARNVYWMYSIVVEDEYPLSRNELMEALADAGIETRTSFYPLNLQPALRALEGHREIECPVSEDLWERGMYLPSSNKLGETQVDRIVGAISSAARTARTS
jgi:perosamine synthetase